MYEYVYIYIITKIYIYIYVCTCKHLYVCIYIYVCIRKSKFRMVLPVLKHWMVAEHPRGPSFTATHTTVPITLKMRWFDDIWCNLLTWTSNIERHRGWFTTEKKKMTVTLKDTGWSDIMRRSRKDSRLWKCHRQGNHADRDHKVRGSPGVCSGLRRLTWRVYQQDMVFPSQWDFRWFNHDEFGTIYNQNTWLVWWSQVFFAPLRVDELEILQSTSGCGIVPLLGGVAWIFVGGPWNRRTWGMMIEFDICMTLRVYVWSLGHILVDPKQFMILEVDVSWILTPARTNTDMGY
jgi:hypothetical protein